MTLRRRTDSKVSSTEKGRPPEAVAGLLSSSIAKEMVYHRGGATKPLLVIASWEGYKKAGPLLFSTETADGAPLRISFSDLAVKLVGSRRNGRPATSLRQWTSIFTTETPGQSRRSPCAPRTTATLQHPGRLESDVQIELRSCAELA